MRRPTFATPPAYKDKALRIKVMKSEARLLIAVVDDDQSAGKALSRLLCAVGLKAETFVSGSEFLKWLQNHAPDCVVLDQDMPQMDGFEVQSRLDADGRPRAGRDDNRIAYLGGPRACHGERCNGVSPQTSRCPGAARHDCDSDCLCAGTSSSDKSRKRQTENSQAETCYPV